jgi:hypothetical protein
VSYSVIAFLLGYQLRATFDFTTTNDPYVTNLEKTSDFLASNQDAQLRQLHRNSSELYLQPQLQDVYPTKASRPSFSKNNPTKCERQWDWPFLDVWTEDSHKDKDQTITTFEVARSNAHETAQGTIRMQVLQRSTNSENYTPRRVVIFVTHGDTMSVNAWHRIAVQYMVWIAWHVAEHRLHDTVWANITNVELAVPCTYPTEILQGWKDLLFPIHFQIPDSDTDYERVSLVETAIWCTNATHPDELVHKLQPLFEDKYGNSSSAIDVVLVPPNEGLMWDLAWDKTFDCKQSHMFRTFMSQFAPWQQSSSVRTTAALPQSTEAKDSSVTPVVCWILRYGNPQRDISNRDEVHGMLLSIFDTVRLLHFTRYHTSFHIKNVMDDCQVMFGVHGAGLVNAMWSTMSSHARTAVVEVLPYNEPQYFRSVSALVGHHYEGLNSGNLLEDAQYHIDLEKSANALRRALDYVAELQGTTGRF